MSPGKSYRYQVVDVFTRHPLEGNPLAVFCEAADLDASTMQKIAQELSLSETVFVVPSRRDDCVARLRIFTPRREMDFAGHPTVGTGFILVQGGRVPCGASSFAVEENIGAISISVDPEERSMFWLRTPPVQFGPTIDRGDAAALLELQPEELSQCAPQVLSAGNPTLYIALQDKAVVDRSALESGKWAEVKSRYSFGPMCVFVFAPIREGAYSRMFAPDYGVSEDPATGSSTGPLACYMLRHGMISSRAGARFVSEQGTRLGRRSLLHVRLQGEGGDGGIDVGGFVTPVIDAVLHL